MLGYKRAIDKTQARARASPRGVVVVVVVVLLLLLLVVVVVVVVVVFFPFLVLFACVARPPALPTYAGTGPGWRCPPAAKPSAASA